jgi:hypothetical protein
MHCAVAAGGRSGLRSELSSNALLTLVLGAENPADKTSRVILDLVFGIEGMDSHLVSVGNGPTSMKRSNLYFCSRSGASQRSSSHLRRNLEAWG